MHAGREDTEEIRQKTPVVNRGEKTEDNVMFCLADPEKKR